MKEVTIKYKTVKTLDALKAMSKYFGFTLEEPKKEKSADIYFINNVPVVRGDAGIDVSKLDKIFSGKNLDASELRKSGWKRGK